MSCTAVPQYDGPQYTANRALTRNTPLPPRLGAASATRIGSTRYAALGLAPTPDRRHPQPTPPFYRYTLNAHRSRYKTERDKISLGTCASQHLPLAGSCSEVAATRRSDARAWSRRPNVYTAQLVVGERRGSSEMRTPLVVGRARVRGPCARRMELDRMDPLFEARACRQDRYEAL